MYTHMLRSPDIVFRQIERDCEFLEAERIMDYSLLVGLHFRDDNTCDKMGLSPFLLRTGTGPSSISVVTFKVYFSEGLKMVSFPLLGARDSYQSEKFMRGYRFLEAELQDRDRVKSGRYVMICFNYFKINLDGIFSY